jgi:hypothetical protein
MKMPLVNGMDRKNAILDPVVRILLLCTLMMGILMNSYQALSGDNKRSGKMNLSALDHADPLSADLVPFFGEPEVSMLLGRIAAVTCEKQIEDGLLMEHGLAKLDILEILYSSTLVKGIAIEVPFKRIADPAIRVRNRFNQWNNLDLTTGELLILAGCETAIPHVVMGQAAIRVDSSNSGQVKAARQCYVIEKFNDSPAKKSALLSDALMQRDDLLRFYALDLLGRRSLLGRAEGAALIAKAIMSGVTQPDNKIDLGYYLTRQYFFDSTLRNDAANLTVVEALAGGMVSETEIERCTKWMNYLGSCVLGEFSANMETDKALRVALIRAIKTPAAGQVTDTLSKLSTLNQRDERERRAGLLEAWRIAVSGR